MRQFGEYVGGSELYIARNVKTEK